MYDILLFENYHQAQNHRFDVRLIGRLLQSRGWKVGVLNLYGEEAGDEVDGIPVVQLPFPPESTPDEYMNGPHTALQSLVGYVRMMLWQRRYMRRVWRAILPMARMFYAGSFHTSMAASILGQPKPVFLWGLRSQRMRGIRGNLSGSWLGALRVPRLRRAFFRNAANNFLFVSNDIIRAEFRALGVSDSHMVRREERCVEEDSGPQYERLSPEVSLLTIGVLRPEKRVAETVRAFQEFHAEQPQSSLTLAGRASAEYEAVIAKSVAECPSGISRRSGFLDYADFNELFTRSHFVVFGDVRLREGSVTNGTMLEALIRHRPIIAPDYDPYAHYIREHGIGISYAPDRPGDLLRAMREASTAGCRSFEEPIRRYLATISFDRVADALSADLRRVLEGKD